MVKMVGLLIRMAFVLIGLAIGFGMLYIGGPGWEGFKSVEVRRGRYQKTAMNRVMMLVGGLCLIGCALSSLILMVRHKRYRLIRR